MKITKKCIACGKFEKSGKMYTGKQARVYGSLLFWMGIKRGAIAVSIPWLVLVLGLVYVSSNVADALTKLSLQ